MYGPRQQSGKNYPKLMELLKKHVDARKLKIRRNKERGKQ